MTLHPLDRFKQQSTYEQIRDSTAKWIVVEAPTGSGKTAYAAAMAELACLKTMALVKTKSLQEAQYGEKYNFRVVKGKGAYPCLHNFSPGADLCKIDSKEEKDLKRKCDKECPYPTACREMLSSNLASLNYSKFLTELRQNGLVSQYEPDVLFLDEAHQLSDIVIEMAGCTLPYNDYLKEFADFIEINKNLPQLVAINQAIDWLSNLLDNLEDNEPYRPKRYEKRAVEAWRKWDSLRRKVENTLNLVEQGKEYWYIQANFQEGFYLKPLTARFHFPHLFDQADKIVLMSATIGEHRTFMSELGIYENYESIIVPNIWPADSRPIYDISEIEVKFDMSESAIKQHLNDIARNINECPYHWTGLIHTPGKRINWQLRDIGKLTKRPVWTSQEGMGTEEALESWLDFQQRKKGALALAWQFHEGVDMPDLNINITACVPYPTMKKGSYEKARFDFDPRAAQSRIGNTMQQQQGRNRRGFKEHYGPQAEKLNCLADAKWTRLKWTLSDDFKESIK